MNIQENVELKNYSTMRLGGNARYLGEATTVKELHDYIEWANSTNVRSIVIGGGSNIVWQDGGYEGLVIVNKIRGITVRPLGGSSASLFTFSAGEDWDEAVRKTVDMGFTGLEKLSYIPGTCGAAPVQNIGAYGSEVKDTLVSVRAYDHVTSDFVTLENDECKFSYRKSIFNTEARGRYAIISITLKLNKENPKPPFYASLEQYLDQYMIRDYTPLIIRNAVIAIRSEKLPDPRAVPNNGSFFANPIVSKQLANSILKNNPNMPHWPAEKNIKISAAWLIEHAGFHKGYRDAATGMGLWKNQALVLVNENAKSTADLLNFKHKIVTAVKNKFGVELIQEPELI